MAARRVAIDVPFVSKGDQTLQGLALAWECQPSAIVRMTARTGRAQVYAAPLALYLDEVFQRSTLKVPAGVVLYYQKG